MISNWIVRVESLMASTPNFANNDAVNPSGQICAADWMRTTLPAVIGRGWVNSYPPVGAIVTLANGVVVLSRPGLFRLSWDRGTNAPKGSSTALPVESMSNAKSNPGDNGVWTTWGPVSAYPDGVMSDVPCSAYRVMVSTTFVVDGGGNVEVLHAASNPVARAATTLYVQRGRIRPESTAGRASGSTHGHCLTSPFADPRLAAVWRRSGTWSRP